MTENMEHLLELLKSVMAMVMFEIAMGGANIFNKFAVKDGMSVKVMVAYRMLFAAISMVPLGIIVEWRSRPKLTSKIFFLGFLLGIGGSLSQNLNGETLALMSTTYAAAMTNLTPAMTSVMAIILRMENLAIKTVVGKAKVLGTILSIVGAMIFIFCKGIEIKLWSTNINLLHQDHRDITASGNQALGRILGVASAVSMALGTILQAKLSIEYPPYSATALMSLCASIQSAVYAYYTERHWSAWKLGWDVRLLAVVYSGVVASGLMVVLMAWVAQRRGALFTASFHPLMLIVVAIADSLMLGEKLHLGSLLGGLFIILGLYTMLLAKSKEMKTVSIAKEDLTS